MIEKKVDRRALKTQKLLKDSLAELLAEKELRTITIQELCDKADIHRVTFYKHFYDIYDLYEQIKKEALSELGLLILKFHEDPRKVFCRELIEFIEKNPKIFKVIFSRYNTGELRSKFSIMIEGVFRLVHSEKQDITIDDKKLDYLSSFWASGTLAVIEKWVHKEYAESNEVMIKLLSDLDEQLEMFIKKPFDNTKYQ